MDDGLEKAAYQTSDTRPGLQMGSEMAYCNLKVNGTEVVAFAGPVQLDRAYEAMALSKIALPAD